MTDTVRMRAVKPHRYAGRALAPGEEYEASPSHARLMKALGNAAPAPAAAPAAAAAAPVAAPAAAEAAPQARRAKARAPDAPETAPGELDGPQAYRTRDMKAEG